MELKQGYKKTDMGIIPEDWGVKQLKDVCDLTSSKRIFESDYVKIGIPFYRGKEISLLNENKKLDEEYFISAEKYNAINRAFGSPCKGDILITAVGTLGNVYLVPNDDKFYFKDGNLIWLRNIKSVLPSYLSIQLNWLKNEVINNAIGSSQKALTIIVLRKQYFVLPPLSEQTSIANALSDMDALISQTEKLIEKKKAIKQGAMQELLKPKEGWVTKKLGDIVGISKGQQLNRSTLKSNGNYPVYNGGVSPSGYTNQYNTVENTIIISEGGNSCGFVNYVTSKFWRGGHCYQISPSIHHNFKFIFYYLKFEEPNIMALRVGSGLPNIQSSRLKDFLIHYPNIEIQNEIVLQLNDIFDEIDIIVNKLNKLKQQKQGMMQVLLTGKIRLIS